MQRVAQVGSMGPSLYKCLVSEQGMKEDLANFDYYMLVFSIIKYAHGQSLL